jgi:multiple sugar transport system permease protein/raffinose/stachyose/melibiose transport system permease protein
MKRLVGWAMLFLLLVVWLIPIAWLVITSLKIERDVVTEHFTVFSSLPTAANYIKAFGKTEISRWLLNSVIVSAVTTIFSALLCSTIAYALARIRFPGRNAIFIFVLAGMMVPFEAIIIQLYLEFNALGLINTLTAMIVPRLAAPVGVFILTQFFQGIPSELEEAAFMDGASRFIIFQSVIVPMGKAAIVAVMILSFINAWNDFLWPLVVASQSARYTITVGIANFQGTHGTEYSLIMAGGVIASVPQILAFLFFRDHIVKGIATTGIRG